MNIISDFNRDVCHNKPDSGAYEWWYFDALSQDGKFSLVIIFYEGIPFSPRYNGQLAASQRKPLAEAFPAISISIYEDCKPIYYSISEFRKEECSFSENEPFVQIGNHTMIGLKTDTGLEYELLLDEVLPGGDAIGGHLSFKGMPLKADLTPDKTEPNQGHFWNLIQPRADVRSELKITNALKNETRELSFSGCGYHDHNLGNEPMKNEFDDWYWGRIHFPSATFVYYVMNRKDQSQYKSWLINPENKLIIAQPELTSRTDYSKNPFLLSYAKKLTFAWDEGSIVIDQSRRVDSGPFYLRFLSEASLNNSEKRLGITEYIRPDRIHHKMYWPLVNMRYRYTAAEKPHWVQKSPMMYRWTW